MRQTLSLIALAVLFCQSGLSDSEAQIVQVGPGYVRAPFVRIYRTPNGTSVRAPFTRIDNGRVYRRYYGRSPYNETYAVPDSEYNVLPPGHELSTAEQQRRRLAEFARRLDQDLTRFSTGSNWQEYLRLPPEVFITDSGAGNDAATQPDLVALQHVLSKYESVAQNDEYQRIAQLGTFRSTHHHLKAYVAMLSEPASPPQVPKGNQATPPKPALPSVLVPSRPDAKPVAQQPEELPLPNLEAPQP